MDSVEFPLGDARDAAELLHRLRLLLVAGDLTDTQLELVAPASKDRKYTCELLVKRLDELVGALGRRPRS